MPRPRRAGTPVHGNILFAKIGMSRFGSCVENVEAVGFARKTKETKAARRVKPEKLCRL
jgi:hypothetical protein